LSSNGTSDGPTIGAFVPTYNEEVHLGPCLDSLRDLCADIVVVDTGSTDRTREVAVEHGARVVECAVELRSDGSRRLDFSKWRNLGIESLTTDYVVTVDADQLWLAETKVDFKKALRMVPAPDMLSVVYYLTSHPFSDPRDVIRGRNLTTRFVRECAFRNALKPYFRSPVHETAAYWRHEKKIDLMINVGAVVDRTPAISPERMKARDASYVRTMKEHLEEHPDDLYVAASLCASQMPAEDPDLVERAWAMVRMALDTDSRYAAVGCFAARKVMVARTVAAILVNDVAKVLEAAAFYIENYGKHPDALMALGWAREHQALDAFFDGIALRNATMWSDLHFHEGSSPTQRFARETYDAHVMKAAAEAEAEAEARRVTDTHWA